MRFKPHLNLTTNISNLISVHILTTINFNLILNKEEFKDIIAIRL